MAGNVSGAREVVQRHQFADYLNIGTSEKANWVLMGVGFTTLDEPSEQRANLRSTCASRLPLPLLYPTHRYFRLKQDSSRARMRSTHCTM